MPTRRYPHIRCVGNGLLSAGSPAGNHRGRPSSAPADVLPILQASRESVRRFANASGVSPNPSGTSPAFRAVHGRRAARRHFGRFMAVGRLMAVGRPLGRGRRTAQGRACLVRARPQSAQQANSRNRSGSPAPVRATGRRPEAALRSGRADAWSPALEACRKVWPRTRGGLPIRPAHRVSPRNRRKPRPPAGSVLDRPPAR
jgi:hypothetical protein